MHYKTVEQLRCENPCLYNDITKWIADYGILNADDAAIVALANIIERYASRCIPRYQSCYRDCLPGYGHGARYPSCPPRFVCRPVAVCLPRPCVQECVQECVEYEPPYFDPCCEPFD